MTSEAAKIYQFLKAEPKPNKNNAVVRKRNVNKRNKP